MDNRIYERRREQFIEKFNNWQTNYIKLKNHLLLFESTELTKAKLDEIQYDVDNFVRENDININLFVINIDQKIIIMGRTLEDELVWESIQRI